MAATSPPTTPPDAVPDGVLTGVAAQAVGGRTAGAMVLAATERHDGVAIRHQVGGCWRDVSYSELGDTARAIGCGLVGLGIEPGDHVAILSSTRAEWTMLDCGALCAGTVVVPIYSTNSPGECRYVLEHSDSRLVFVEDADQLAKVLSIRDECPMLEYIVALAGTGEGVMSLDELRAHGTGVDPARLERIQDDLDPDDVATVIYTSGTTGPPKGCMTTHRNFLSTVSMYERRLDIDPPVVIFMFLPLAHSLARVTEMVALDVGGTLAFWSGDATRILDDLAVLQPTHFPSVPRLFEKAHQKALDRVEDAGGLQRKIFHWAVEVGREVAEREATGRTVPTHLRVQHALADRLVLHKVRALFGPRLRQALTGAAPISREVLEFFRACGIVILEGYGMTETTAAATLNTRDAYRFGTVGRPLPDPEVAIAEDGEILMRGPHVFAGYLKDPKATAEALGEELWMHSGDLGALDDDGFLAITGRKKDLIITSSGKNITPTNIESAIRESRWISQAVVYGDDHSYIVALVTLDPEELPALAEHVGMPADPAAMATDSRVRAVVQEAIDWANGQFARVEQVKRFAVLDHDLSQEGGELTPTMKIKRAAVYRLYREIFEGLYEDADGPAAPSGATTDGAAPPRT